MKNIFLLLTLALTLYCCKNETAVEAQDLITSFSNDTIYTESGKNYAIKGLKDSTTTVLFLVRHAEKDLKGGDDPNLTDIGRKRAEKLAALMKNVRLDYIGSTSTQRTKETVQNTAVQNNIPIGFYNQDGQSESIVGFFKGNYKGKKGLIVGHSNSIPGILNGFVSKDDQYKEIPENDYSRFYVISYVSDGQIEVLELNY